MFPRKRNRVDFIIFPSTSIEATLGTHPPQSRSDPLFLKPFKKSIDANVRAVRVTLPSVN